VDAGTAGEGGRGEGRGGKWVRADAKHGQRLVRRPGRPKNRDGVGAPPLPCLRVNADAGGRPDEKDVRTDIFIEKRLL
jgi:hypothetical protein